MNQMENKCLIKKQLASLKRMKNIEMKLTIENKIKEGVQNV